MLNLEKKNSFWYEYRCFGRYREGERGTNDIMDKFCADDPNAEECKVFDE